MKILIIAMTFLLSSCSLFEFTSTEGPKSPRNVPTQNTQIRYNNVAILDKSLEHKIAVQGSRWERTVTNNVKVMTTLRNRTDYNQIIELRVQFYDADSVSIGEPSAWKKFYLSPNEIKTWSEFSTMQNLHSYYIELREGR